MPQLATVVSELLSYLRDQSLERYRSWGAVELDFTEEELEEWLTVIGAAGAVGADRLRGADPAGGWR